MSDILLQPRESRPEVMSVLREITPGGDRDSSLVTNSGVLHQQPFYRCPMALDYVGVEGWRTAVCHLLKVILKRSTRLSCWPDPGIRDCEKGGIRKEQIGTDI
jgi:hypothetical protein